MHFKCVLLCRTWTTCLTIQWDDATRHHGKIQDSIVHESVSNDVWCQSFARFALWPHTPRVSMHFQARGGDGERPNVFCSSFGTKWRARFFERAAKVLIQRNFNSYGGLRLCRQLDAVIVSVGQLGSVPTPPQPSVNLLTSERRDVWSKVCGSILWLMCFSCWLTLNFSFANTWCNFHQRMRSRWMRLKARCSRSALTLRLLHPIPNVSIKAFSLDKKGPVIAGSIKRSRLWL